MMSTIVVITERCTFMGKSFKFIVLPLAFAFNIATVVIGVLYNSDTYCKLKAPYVLEVIGGIGIVMCLILVVICMVSKDDFSLPILVITNVINIIVLIWASVLIFGTYLP